MKRASVSNLADLPNVDVTLFKTPEASDFEAVATSTHPPRILLLYGSLRERSFSRLLTFEAQRLLQSFGAETRVFDPTGLPLPDGHPEDHPKVQELRSLAAWSEGMVWTSPERHGAMTGIMKAQIDWIPLSIGSVRPTQERRLPSWKSLAGPNPSTR
jgi:arsenical resistance protein ArsH